MCISLMPCITIFSLAPGLIFQLLTGPQQVPQNFVCLQMPEALESTHHGLGRLTTQGCHAQWPHLHMNNGCGHTCRCFLLRAAWWNVLEQVASEGRMQSTLYEQASPVAEAPLQSTPPPSGPRKSRHVYSNQTIPWSSQSTKLLHLMVCSASSKAGASNDHEAHQCTHARL